MTRIEFETGLKNIPMVMSHPSLIGSFLRGGRKGLVQKAVKISLMEASNMNLNHHPELDGSHFHTLLGKMGAYSQEFLYFLVRKYKPKVVIETGVYRGISSAYILQGLNDNGVGQLYSIDLPQARYITSNGKEDLSLLIRAEVPGFGVPNYLRHRWKLILGDSKIELPNLLKELGAVDLFYHDSQHTYDFMAWEYNTVMPYLSNHSILASDDISWNAAFSDFCSQNGLKPYYVMSKFGFTEIDR